MNRTPHPGCPAEEMLQELAAGICDPDTSEKTTEHAAHCSHCGPLLAQYLNEFSDDLPMQDAALLGQLQSSTAKWQKKFIRDHLAAGNSKAKKPFLAGLWPRLAAAAASVAVAVGGLLFWLRPNDLQRAQQFVASAYAERRTTEMRLPGAQYGVFQESGVERSGDHQNNLINQSEPLLKAAAILNKKKKDAELNPKWLEIEGEISLLEAGPDGPGQAIEDFRKAQEKDDGNPRLKIDLAAGYFEEERRADHPNLAKTIDLLEGVLKNPKLDANDRATALFDLAMAYEKSELWPSAVATWQEYLAQDHNSDWSKEAQKHLDDAKRKTPAPRQQGFNSPHAFLQGSSTPEVQTYIEPFQDAALSTWLTKAVEDASSDEAKAVHRLAELLEQQHSDLWWRDFLKAVRPNDLPAVEALSAAFIANTNALPQEALQQSGKAAEWFAQHENVAGELRARFEQVYALKRMLASSPCLMHARNLSRRLADTQYYWLKAQVAMEEATCENWVSDYKSVGANVALSRKVAEDRHFPELQLRITGMDAGMKRLQKKYDDAWEEAVAGLHGYWQGLYSPDRLLQFYAAMYLSAQEIHLSHASQALMLQAVAIRERNSPDNLTLKTVLYLDLANELRRQGQVVRAEEMSAKAAALLEQIPANEQGAQRAASVTQVELADLVLQDGNSKWALDKLTSIRKFLQVQDDFTNLDFYRVLGNVQLRLRHLDEAVSAYESAIDIAERALDHMQDDASRVLWIRASDESYRGLTQALLDANEDRKALVAWERLKSRSFQTLKIPGGARQSGIRDVVSAASLPNVSQPHLIYASFNESLHVWLINGLAIKSRSFPKKQTDLEQQVREFVEDCANPHSPPDRLERESEKLYSLLLQPITDLPGTNTITVELDQPMAKLTMEALRTPDGGYFGDAYSVIYSPGLLVENTLRSPLPLQPIDSFLLVDASPASGSGTLPGHEMEQNSVTHTFPHRTLMTALDATPARVKEALKKSVGFDFIGHAKSDGTGVALVLNPSVSLKASDFVPESMPKLRFAVLSACASGTARNDLLDTGSLVRSFLAARVPTVIASHWNVDSESTSQFMQAFYGKLARGETVAAALQSARKELRSTRNHPYYWAAFSLNGRVS